MKYLKYFKTDVDYKNYFNSNDFVTPNVSYVEDTNIVHYNPYDLIIMTSESNPEVMKVCYNQGWAKSPNEMYASEAAKVTSIGTAFESLGNGGSASGNSGSNISFTFSFDEFKYFTGVDSIVDNAFYDSNIVSITIPDSVTSISASAFDGCDSLPVENNLRYADTYLIKAVDKSLSTYTIKEGTKWIGDSAFRYCSSLTSITIPDSVTSIGSYAFDGCDSLPVENGLRYADTYLIKAVDNLSTYTIKEGTKWIGDSAFRYCSSLTSITIPDSVTSIGSYAFDGCSYLTSITIPDSVTSIGKGVFNGCDSLPVENNLRYADRYLVGVEFKDLSTYTIKEGTKWIGDSAFLRCSIFTSITIPDSVTSIEGLAFGYCNKLNKITCLATTAPRIMFDTFEEIKSDGSLEIPAGSDYSSWMSTGDYYLGKYNWTTQEI